jgi:hypothetical protein
MAKSGGKGTRKINKNKKMRMRRVDLSGGNKCTYIHIVYDAHFIIYILHILFRPVISSDMRWAVCAARGSCCCVLKKALSLRVYVIYKRHPKQRRRTCCNFTFFLAIHFPFCVLFYGGRERERFNNHFRVSTHTHFAPFLFAFL